MNNARDRFVMWILHGEHADDEFQREGMKYALECFQELEAKIRHQNSLIERLIRRNKDEPKADKKIKKNPKEASKQGRKGTDERVCKTNKRTAIPDKTVLRTKGSKG